MLDIPNHKLVPATHLLTPDNPILVYSRGPKGHQEPYHSQPSNPEASPSEDNTTTRMDDLDFVPIALRKGLRSCVKYPISNHLIYTKLSHQFKVFFASINNIEILNNIQCAMKDPMWKAVVLEEINALVGNNI